MCLLVAVWLVIGLMEPPLGATRGHLSIIGSVSVTDVRCLFVCAFYFIYMFEFTD